MARTKKVDTATISVSITPALKFNKTDDLPPRLIIVESYTDEWVDNRVVYADGLDREIFRSGLEMDSHLVSCSNHNKWAKRGDLTNEMASEEFERFTSTIREKTIPVESLAAFREKNTDKPWVSALDDENLTGMLQDQGFIVIP